MAVILIADDNSVFRVTLEKLLMRVGHTVLLAADGLDAERGARDTAIDLLITDIVMPDKEGLALVRDLKARAPDLRIIAMSGGGRAGALTLLDMASRFGADAVLSKPFRAKELLDTVDAVLAPRRSAAPATGR